MYAVSQAGVGARSQPRDGQNPFEDLIRVLRLDRPVTKGTDPLPAPSARLAIAANTTTPAPTSKPESTAVETNPAGEEAKP